MIKFLNKNTAKASIGRVWQWDYSKNCLNYEIISATFRCLALTSLSLLVTYTQTHTHTDMHVHRHSTIHEEQRKKIEKQTLLSKLM